MSEVNVLIGGEAGQGLVTVGQILAESLVRAGFHLCVTQSYQSRIRGGHNTYAIRGGTEPVDGPAERFDLIVALNRETLELHRDDLGQGGLFVVGEEETADRPYDGPEGRCLTVPFNDFGPSRYANTAAAGVAAFLVGLEQDLVAETLREALEKKDEKVIGENCDVLANAYRWGGEIHHGRAKFLPAKGPNQGRSMMHGNEAIARGAVSSGLGFFAYYPMTPSTSIANTLIAMNREKPKRFVLEQAEDEIAAINMAIGASFVGAPSMVATSGGGFALMVEGVSLAAMTETPLVIALAQRPGPATGLPTRTEQGDLELVLYAGHGEFPRAVFSPGTVEECFHMTRGAFAAAEASQGPVLILTDQFLADSFRAVEALDGTPATPAGDTAYSGGEPYRRYAITETGISPRLIPGTSEHLVIADSDEHTEDGHITEDLAVRVRMVDKRLRKEKLLNDMAVPPVYAGDENAELLLVSWGSSKGAVAEAAAVLRSRGTRIGTLHFPQVWPLVSSRFAHYLTGAARVVCVEGNATGQFARLIHRETGFRVQEQVRRYDGLPFTADYILRALQEKG